MPAELATSLSAAEAQRLEQAEALVRGFCGWHIAPSRTVTAAQICGTGDTVLLLPSLYVTNVSAVSDDTTALTVETDYTWSRSGVLTRKGRWSTKLVTVTYVHGYAAVPAEVTAIVQAIAQRAINNPGSVVREQAGPFSATYSTTGANEVAMLALLDSEKETLRRYRIPPAA